MLIGLAEESDPWESEQASAWTPEGTGVQTFSTPQSTMTVYPATVKKVVPRAGATKVTKVLDTVLPRTLGANGAVRIWGLPPAVAYTLVAILLTGAGLYAYRTFGGGRRATNPTRGRRRSRGRKSRRKR